MKGGQSDAGAVVLSREWWEREEVKEREGPARSLYPRKQRLACAHALPNVATTVS